jgi:mannose 2-epimerase
MQNRCERWLREIQDHLKNELLPYWATHGIDKQYGGFLTYFDRHGKPTGETVKTLLGHARMVYTYASAHRVGFGEGQFLDMARQGVEFLLDHFLDRSHGGWYWTAEQDGTPLNQSKLTYGHAFILYALSEYLMASGDYRIMEKVVGTYEVLETLAADNCYGGYYEFLERDWSKKKPGKYGGDRKSFDVHMHLMEAFTNLYEATGVKIYKERTIEIITLIFERILHPEFGTGIAQFALDWTPLPQILFADVWGSDRDADGGGSRPLNNTSFGHNVEFAWLLKHACRTLDVDIAPYKDTLRRIFDHCCRYGIDWERGGVYCEGPHDGPARERNKEFWQQAECLVGLLDAYALFGDAKYLDAYDKVHRFVMDYVVHHEVGEWFPLFDENNNLVWDYMGHAWKINYHTVRSMIQSETRLLKILHRASGQGRAEADL